MEVRLPIKELEAKIRADRSRRVVSFFDFICDRDLLSLWRVYSFGQDRNDEIPTVTVTATVFVSTQHDLRNLDSMKKEVVS